MKSFKVSEQGLELIKKFEGFSATPYLCPAGQRTIGYGHALKDNENFAELSPLQAEFLLKQDLRWVEKTLNNTVSSDLIQNEVDALASLIYNIGGTAFRNSTLLRLLNLENYMDAADEFPKWNHVKGKVNDGLTKRRKEERELFMEN